MKFLIIDDHELVRTALRELVGRQFSSAQISEASDATSAMTCISSGPWDVIVLDIDLPDRSGLELIQDIKLASSRNRILALSGHDEREIGFRALKAGAQGYIAKASPNAEIVTAITQILSGKKYISADLAARIIDSSLNPGTVLHDALSDRELDVLRRLGQGTTLSEIANQMKLSVKTVSTYRSRILTKLGLQTTGDLVRYAVQNRVA